MVIGESYASGSGDKNLYDILDEVLYVQYSMGRNVWLFKCWWYDTDVNKSQRTNVELAYKSLNTSHFWFTKKPVVLATQPQQIFYLDGPKNGSNWKVVKIVQNKCIWDVPEVDDFENEHLNVLEIVANHWVDKYIEDDTLYRTDVDPTIIEGSVMHHVTDDFIDDVDEHLSNESGASDDEW